MKVLVGVRKVIPSLVLLGHNQIMNKGREMKNGMRPDITVQ